MKKYQNLLSDNFHFLVVKIAVYLIRRVFVMCSPAHVNISEFFNIELSKCTLH